MRFLHLPLTNVQDLIAYGAASLVFLLSFSSVAALPWTKFRGSPARQKVCRPSESLMKDLRAFIIARHESFGYLLLRSLKDRKGEHYQLSGGHVDASDADHVCDCTDPDLIAQYAAARELFEETGIDLRMSLNRLIPLGRFGIGSRKRRYFELCLSQQDSFVPLPASADQEGPLQCFASVGPVECFTPATGEPFYVRLSPEHTGFAFVQDLETAAHLVEKHSGGHSSAALLSYGEIVAARKCGSSEPTPSALSSHGRAGGGDGASARDNAGPGRGSSTAEDAVAPLGHVFSR